MMYLWVSVVANCVMLVAGLALVYWVRSEQFVLRLQREQLHRRAAQTIDVIDAAKSHVLASEEYERRIVELSAANVRLQEERDRIQVIHDRFKTESANAQELLLRAFGKLQRRYLAACKVAEMKPEPVPYEMALVEAGFQQEMTGQESDQAIAAVTGAEAFRPIP